MRNMKKKFFVVFVLFVLFMISTNFIPFDSVAATNYLTNGTQFKDTLGNVIHAHGGGMIYYEGYYYWYGEYRDTTNHFLGVSCYRSKDLMNWEHRGEVLTPNSASELKSCNIERPKVMYNPATKEFVMWMHWENGVHYGEARAAVAYCSTPDGKYTYKGSFRPMVNSGVIDHDKPGYMSRDCNVFVDTDGKGYFISSSNENMDLHLYELTPDFKSIASLKAKLFVGKQREAPCLIKRNGYYYLITSGCTGWDPNQGKYCYSKNLASGWSELVNLGSSTTYNSQPAFIIPVQGSSTTSYLYTGDRWAGAWGGKVNDSQYVWLPLVFESDTKLELPYYDSIKIDASAGTISEYGADSSTQFKIINKNSNKALDTQEGVNSIIQWTNNNSQTQNWYFVDVGDGYKKIVNAKSTKVLDVSSSSKDDGGSVIQWQSNGGSNQQWKFVDTGDGHYKIINRNSGKLLDVYKWATEDGASIQQWSDTGGENQHWKLVPVNNSPTPKSTNTPTPTYTPTTKPSTGTFFYGDISNDGSVDSTDYAILKRFLLSLPTTIQNPNWPKCGDLNKDSVVDSTDYAILKRFLLGQIQSLPIG